MNPLMLDLSFLRHPAFQTGLVLGLTFWLGTRWGALREARRIFRSKRYASRREAMLRGWRPSSFLDRLLLGRSAESILATGGTARGGNVPGRDPATMPAFPSLRDDRGPWRPVSAAPTGAPVVDCSRPRNNPGAS